MMFIGLMILVLAVATVLSTLLGGRRRSLRGHDPRSQIQSSFRRTQDFTTGDGSWQQETTVTGATPYGFTHTPWGLPTDVPLSEASREAIDSDITAFGTELRELDFDVVDHELTDEARGDYTKALDAYENAKRALQGSRADSDATHITHLLEEGRYSVACVSARALGRPVPAKRPPCFFDPAHGPSVEDVIWAPPGGVERGVPACAVDVARIGLGADPRIRMVGSGSSTVPYWEDGAHAAWAQGYYGPWMGEPSMRRMAQGDGMISGFSRLMGMRDD